MKFFGKICLISLLCSAFSLAAKTEEQKYIFAKEGKEFQEKKLATNGKNIKTFKIDYAREKVIINEEELAFAKTPKPLLTPSTELGQGILAHYESYKPDEFVELLYEMQMPANIKKEDLGLYLLNRLIKMQTMKGIKYFSGRANKMKTYINRSYIVSAVRSYKRAEVPQFSSLPAHPLKIIVLQDDNRFAPTWYEVKLSVGSDNSLLITMTNITAIKILFFKALDPKKVVHNILIYPKDNKLFVYSISQVHNTIKEVLGIKLNLANSFDHRMSSIQGWIASQIY